MPDKVGLGFNIQFGRIYHHPDDDARIYRYETPDGAEHFFCWDLLPTPYTNPQVPTCGNLRGRTLDSSAIHIDWFTDTNKWVVLPGDGTRLIMDHYAGPFSLDLDGSVNLNAEAPWGGWYTSQIETIAQDGAGQPQRYLHIDYVSNWVPNTMDSNTAAIQRITDNVGREITLTYTPSGIDITVPSIGYSSAIDLADVAVYELVLGNETFWDPELVRHAPSFTPQQVTRQVLREIRLPPVGGTTLKYTFDYGPQYPADHHRFGYLEKWTLPTGAKVEYGYSHYQTSQYAPLHSEIARRTIDLDPADQNSEVFTWTYARFGYAVTVGGWNGQSFAGSNPYKVRVTDPFSNLTVYNFNWTVFGTQSCIAGCGCPGEWDDGILNGVDFYAGPDENYNRLLRRELYDYTSDSGYVYRNSICSANTFPAQPTANRLALNVRQSGKEVITQGIGGLSGSHRIVHSDWTDTSQASPTLIRLPRETQEYRDGQLYRVTRTEYEPTDNFHQDHHFVLTKDSAGQILSRTDTQFNINRLECQVERKYPTAPPVNFELNCASPGTVVGDVRTSYTYGPSGSLSGTTLSGGDGSPPGFFDMLTFYNYQGGTLRTRSSMGWLDVDRDVDGNTGLILTSRQPSDPASGGTDYSWDNLGRLTQIAPPSPESPVVISYPSIYETRVQQAGSAELVYRYDTLGRVFREERQNVTGTYDYRLTEYDIAGRVTRQSQWAASTTPTANLAWTANEYRFVEPGSGAFYTDPLGRRSKVTRPDGSVTDTKNAGLATTVTVHGIETTTGSADAATKYVNDALGRLVEVDSPGAGADATYTYDELDNLVEVRLTNPAAPAQVQTRRFFYDALSRLRSAIQPESGTTEYLEYNARGDLRKYIDSRGNTLANTYDSLGRLLTRSLVVSPTLSLSLVQNSYDSYPSSDPLFTASTATGKLTQQKSYRINHSQATPTATLVSTRKLYYGPSNGALSCPVSGLSTMYPYPAYFFHGLNGRLARTKFEIPPVNGASAVKTDHCYNELGLEDALVYPESSSPSSVVVRLYNYGVLWEVNDYGRQWEYARDIQYFPGGTVHQFERHNGMKDVIDRDVLERPVSFRLQNPAGATATAPGGPSSLQQVFHCGGQHAVGYVNMEYCIPPGPTLPPGPQYGTWEIGPYTYDGAGNIREIGQNDYHYDTLNRLVEASIPWQTVWYSQTYAYDPFGNMVQNNTTQMYTSLSTLRGYEVDLATNRLTRQLITSQGIDSIDYGYDPNGNMVVAGEEGYVFDEENRLADVWGADGYHVAHYDYDANGYRVRKIADGLQTVYLRDTAGQVLSEYSGPEDLPAAWNKNYIYALGQALSMVKNEKPLAPVGVWATGVSTLQLTLNWDEVAESDILRYHVQRTCNNGTGDCRTYTKNFLVTSTAMVDSFEQGLNPGLLTYA